MYMYMYNINCLYVYIYIYIYICIYSPTHLIIIPLKQCQQKYMIHINNAIKYS